MYIHQIADADDKLMTVSNFLEKKNFDSVKIRMHYSFLCMYVKQE